MQLSIMNCNHYYFICFAHLMLIMPIINDSHKIDCVLSESNLKDTITIHETFIQISQLRLLSFRFGVLNYAFGHLLPLSTFGTDNQHHINGWIGHDSHIPVWKTFMRIFVEQKRLGSIIGNNFSK